MDLPTAIVVILLITMFFVIGTKISFYFKNRELLLIRESYEQQLKETRTQHENFKAGFTEDMFKQVKRAEESLQVKLVAKDEQIRTLTVELEGLKAWKDEMGLKLAEFKGASQGNPQMLIFKLLEHNQKLNQTLTTKWIQVEKNLTDNLQQTIGTLKKLFVEAELLHRDGLEIISIYESRMPEDLKRKVHDDLLKLPGTSAKIPSLPQST